jgi:transposase InsO family protein
MKYAFIREYSNQHPVGLMCEVLGASRSGYYAWLRREPGSRAKANQELLAEIRASHQRGKHVYGSPRIHRDLQSRGICCGKNRVARLMRVNGIVAKQVRRFRITTRVRTLAKYAPDRLQRRFQAERPHQVWTSDITYIWTDEGWLYLAIILDIFSRSIVAWATSARIDAQLVAGAFRLALQRSSLQQEVVLHSDRGSQYVSDHMHRLMMASPVRIIPSHAYSCYDNAITESFFHTLKNECIHHEHYTTRYEAHQSLFAYIDVFYNRQRLHSALGYRIPAQVASLAEDA